MRRAENLHSDLVVDGEDDRDIGQRICYPADSLLGVSVGINNIVGLRRFADVENDAFFRDVDPIVWRDHIGLGQR